MVSTRKPKSRKSRAQPRIAVIADKRDEKQLTIRVRMGQRSLLVMDEKDSLEPRNYDTRRKQDTAALAIASELCCPIETIYAE